MWDAVVFLDTETTGKGPRRRAWEIAMIRRDATGDREITLYVDVADLDLPHADPKALAIGRFDQRHPQRDGVLTTPNTHLLHDRAPRWHYQPWDIAVLATGYLIARQIPVQRSAEATSRACGVATPGLHERHTALGDARWVRRLHDRIFAEATYPHPCVAA